MAARLVATLFTLFAAAALAGEKATITYRAPASTEDDRPVATSIVVGPQGGDYALKIEFNKEPWGEHCKARCANTTIFLDTDDNKATGLKLSDPKAAEVGADLSVTIQGSRELGSQGAGAGSGLQVKVKQLGVEPTGGEEANVVCELDGSRDIDRVRAEGNSLSLLIDVSNGNLPVGRKLRVVYHPPDSKPLVGTAKGLSTRAASQVEIFKKK